LQIADSKGIISTQYSKSKQTSTGAEEIQVRRPSIFSAKKQLQRFKLKTLSKQVASESK
jgi:hypothetical protein